MLLIHDDEAQVKELHRVLDDGMRSDDDIGLAGDNLQQRLPLLRRLHRAGQHGDGDSFGNAGANRRPMLRRQHLRRREKGSLLASVDRLQHGARGHQGLARAHLALQQTHHGRGATQVRVDLRDDAALARSQFKGQLAEQFVAVALQNRWHRGCRARLDIALAQGHNQPNRQRLIVFQTLDGAFGPVLTRFVDLADGLVQRHHHAVVQWLRNRRRVFQHLVDSAHDVPRCHLAARRVDGDPLALQESVQ